MNLKPILIAAGIGMTLAISGMALASDLKDTSANTAKHHAMETTKSQAKDLTKEQTESLMPKTSIPETKMGMKNTKSAAEEAEEAEEAESIDGIEEPEGTEVTDNMAEDAASEAGVDADAGAAEADTTTKNAKGHTMEMSKGTAAKHKAQ
ncbi:MAG: hypothetical protein IAF00_01970 [Phycisphaerales bacterium]|nr:hypothetical protein [Phycisphaerales bacterium]